MIQLDSTLYLSPLVIGLSNIDYKQVSGITEYDNLTYNFNFDILLPEETEYTGLATREVSVVADTGYTFPAFGRRIR